jgi:hypothetical protein
MLEIYKQVINHFGVIHQIQKAIEELEELKVELRLILAGEGMEDSVKEEMADVYNMLEQLKIIFKFKDSEIIRIMEDKMRKVDNNG